MCLNRKHFIQQWEIVLVASIMITKLDGPCRTVGLDQLIHHGLHRTQPLPHPSRSFVEILSIRIILLDL